MPIVIQPYAEQHAAAVRRFNDRLQAGAQTSQFPLSPVPAWLPPVAGRKLFQEYFVAVDEAANVRGACILKHQEFCIQNQTLSISDLQLPISEGTVDRRYSMVAVQLLRHALKQQPLMFGLGMGGYDGALARLLKAAGWSMFSVPFFFRVVHPGAFLRNVSYLRRRAAHRCLLDFAAMAGLGWLGVHGLQALLCRKETRGPDLAAEVVDEFSDWADQLWREVQGQYGMAAVRDAETLRILYPREDARFIRLRISQRSRTIGWAVLLHTALANHKQFGNMRLGSIADCFASPADAAKVVGAARDHLKSQGVDLIVSNQSHAAWRRGFRRAGFLPGPSNFIFTSSPKLTQMLCESGVQDQDLHFNRGDGDGPIHL